MCSNARVQKLLSDCFIPNAPWFYLHEDIGCFFAPSSIVKTGRSFLSMHPALLLTSIAYKRWPACSDARQDSEAMWPVERDVLLSLTRSQPLAAGLML